MKNSFVGFFLSFVLPGAGLAYLGKWKPAVINFIIVAAIITGAVFLLPPETWVKLRTYIIFGCLGASAAIAKGNADALAKSGGA